MGLISAALNSVGGVMADQWKEYFYCESLPADVLMVKGQKVLGNRSSNTKASDNIISNGSGIVVADGQCMMIVEQGEIVEFCAEPGMFTWDSSTEPSIFTGKLGTALKETFKAIGRRFTYGGSTGKDQRVYYFNTKELLDNKFGTQNPVPFRIVDRNVGLDIDVSVRCAGVYSYVIADPMIFYTKICGNVSSEYRRDQLDNTLKTEFISALQPAFAKLSAMGLRPSEIIAHNTELEAAMNEVLSEKWGALRGLKIVNVALATVTLPEEDQEYIKKLQLANAYGSSAQIGAGTITQAYGEALVAGAKNENGAMAGIMGMGMVGAAGNVGAGAINSLYGQAAQQQAAQQAAPAGGWTCPACGKVNTGNFCPSCGAKKPEAAAGWTCPTCGKVNEGNFCTNCGTKKPEASGSWFCPTCGKENTGNFCSGCGTKKP